MRLEYSDKMWTLSVGSLVLYRGPSLTEARDAADLFDERTVPGMRAEVDDEPLPPRDVDRDAADMVEMHRVLDHLSSCEVDYGEHN